MQKGKSNTTLFFSFFFFSFSCLGSIRCSCRSLFVCCHFIRNLFFLSFIFIQSLIHSSGALLLMRLFPLYLYKYLTENVQSKSHFIPMCAITIDIERNAIMCLIIQQHRNKFVVPFISFGCNAVVLFEHWPTTLTKHLWHSRTATRLSFNSVNVLFNVQKKEREKEEEEE